MGVTYPEGTVAGISVLVTKEGEQNVITIDGTPNDGAIDFIKLATDGIKVALEFGKVPESPLAPPSAAKRRPKKKAKVNLRNNVQTTQELVKAIVNDLDGADIAMLKDLINSDFFVLIFQDGDSLTARTNYETEEYLHQTLVAMKKRGDMAMAMKAGNVKLKPEEK